MAFCTRKFSLVVASEEVTYFNQFPHTAYGWCNSDPDSVLDATVGVGAASSTVSQEDAETTACANAKAILTQTLLPAICPGGPWTVLSECDAPPVVTYYSEAIQPGVCGGYTGAAQYSCSGGTYSGPNPVTITGVAAGAFTSIISQADANMQAADQYFAQNDTNAEEDILSNCEFLGGLLTVNCS
jgi:hypothetical protein